MIFEVGAHLEILSAQKEKDGGGKMGSVIVLATGPWVRGRLRLELGKHQVITATQLL